MLFASLDASCISMAMMNIAANRACWSGIDIHLVEVLLADHIYRLQDASPKFTRTVKLR